MKVDISVEPTTADQDTALSFFRALGGEGALGEIFTSDATWTVWGDSPLAGTYHGREAVLTDFHARAAELFDADADGRLEVKKLIGEHHTVAAEFEFQTTTALGRKYHNHYVEVFEIRGSHIAHVREYMDTEHLRKVCY
jgi:ketosteroid isomerase-like protein